MWERLAFALISVAGTLTLETTSLLGLGFPQKVAAVLPNPLHLTAMLPSIQQFPQLPMSLLKQQLILLAMDGSTQMVMKMATSALGTF